MELLMDHLSKGIFLILMLSLPCVLTAASVGLVVGILQAVTQVQEQTLSAAPKVLFVFLLLVFGGGTMMELVSAYIREAVTIAFEEVPMAGARVMPPQDPDESARRRQAFYGGPRSPGSRGSGFDPGPSKAADVAGTDPTDASQKMSGRQTPKQTVAEQMHLQKRSRP